jgi:hypothetical protein
MSPPPPPIPSPSAPMRLRGLQRLAMLVRSLVAVGAAILACVPFWLWGSPQWLEDHARRNLGLAGPVTIDTQVQWWAALVSVPGLLVGFFLLWQLWQLFGEYGQGRVFRLRAVRHLRRFAYGVLSLGLVDPLTHTATVLVLTWHNAPGHRQLLIELSSDDYLHVLLGAVLLAIAHVMAEAVRVADENAEFV